MAADFVKLYSQYFDDVYKYILSLCRNESEAEEVTQETFFKALQNIDSFHGKCRVYVWLCQISKNTYFSRQKKQKRFIPDEDIPEQAADGELEGDYLTEETSLEMQQALHSMDEPYKEVLMLRIFGEMSFARIGQLFQKTESWARVTYHRGKIKLKEMLL